MVTFEWSWFAFWAGVIATVLAEFILLVAVAINQWSKQRKEAKKATDAFTDLIETWGTKPTK